MNNRGTSQAGNGASYLGPWVLWGSGWRKPADFPCEASTLGSPTNVKHNVGVPAGVIKCYTSSHGTALDLPEPRLPPIDAWSLILIAFDFIRVDVRYPPRPSIRLHRRS